MRAVHSEWSQRQPRSVDEECGKAFAPSPFSSAALVILVLAVLITPKAALAQGAFNLLASPGGITGVLTGTDYINTFGNMNALGIGAPQTGLKVTAVANGAIYFSQYQVQFTGLPAGHTARLTAYVSANFNHPLALVPENCPSTAACNTSGGYSPTSTSAAGPSIVVASMGNATVTVGIGLFLPDNDGAGAFAGVDTAAVISYSMTDLTTNRVVATATWTYNGTPNNTVQVAVRLTLGTATGGLTVTPAADYSMAFGNVNGLGIGPGAGLTTVASAGGIIYSTPYLLNPVFTDFSSTTATIKAYVSTNFAHPAVLKAEDAAAGAGPYTAISTNVAAPTQIATTAGDRTSITRYLGLFVANTNGATSFTGTDNATLTFTMTVP